VVESGLTADDGSFVFVLSGGTTVRTTVSAGGFEGVQSGGLESGASLQSGAQLRVGSGGSATMVSAASGGTEFVSGGIDLGATVAGVQDVYAGGTAINAQVSSGGVQDVYSGGVASGGTVSGGGTVYVDTGGSGQGILVAAAGGKVIVEGGVTSGTVLSGAPTYGSDGLINGGPAEQVLSGGTSVGTIVSSGGLYRLGGFDASGDPIAGGTSIDAVVLSGGLAEVDQGGIALSPLISGGNFGLGVTATSSGGIVDPGVAGGVVVSAKLVDQGYLGVFSGGTALDTTLPDAGELLEVYSGGVSISALVESGGSFLVMSGATALNTTAFAGLTSTTTAYMEVESGGLAISSVLMGAGGDLTTIPPAEVVSSGGTSIADLVSSGAYLTDRGLTSGATVLSGGAIAVLSGGAEVSGTIDGVEEVFGGTASNDVVSSGGTVYASSGALLSNLTVNSGGSVIVVESRISGSGFNIQSGGHLYLDSATVGALQNDGDVVASGGTVDLSGGVAGFGSITVDSGATLDLGANTTVADLTLSAGGTVALAGETLTTDPVTVSSGGTILGYGTITGAFSDAGVVIDSGGALDVTGAATGSGAFLIEDGGTLELDGPVAQGVTVYFASGGSGTLDLGDASAMSGTVSGQVAGDVVADVTPPDLICFLQGTRILTPTGEVPVEDLRIGDLVMTRFSAMQPIKWIGRQCFDRRFVRSNPNQMPIRIRPGALGERRPARDLYVSPGHSMLIGDQLILAKFLINGVTITQNDAPETIRFHHIELDTHDCVVAEGAWSETFADGEDLRSAFHNAAEFRGLYPDTPKARAPRLCGPRPLEGPALERALRDVLGRLPKPLQAGPLRGFLDQVSADTGEITGWAQDMDHPETPVDLEVLYQDRVIGVVLSCAFRDDLAAANIGRGRCAFWFTSPFPLDPHALHTLKVRRASDGLELSPTEACARSLGALPDPSPFASQAVG
jgi:autotransporter passenger strand-loop-strand repeat protein